MAARNMQHEKQLSNFLISEFSVFTQTEMWRIVATLISVVVTMVLMKLVQRRARLSTISQTEVSRRRGNLVLLKNLLLFSALIVIGTIWASKIAGVALSLAAVAGALLIVSKEFLLNLLGTASLTISRLYRVGDFIEIEGIVGRVIDTDLLATTLSEALDGSQLTSRTVAIPHSILLVKPVRNLTATGEYVVNLLRVGAGTREDLIALEQILLEAANEVCQPWISQADAHLKRIESRDLMDLPSAEPRVIVQLQNEKEALLSLRYACRPNDRVKVEQKILRKYIARRSLLHREPEAVE
jgi:small-conductance mechanosensitive channel